MNTISLFKFLASFKGNVHTYIAKTFLAVLVINTYNLHARLPFGIIYPMLRKSRLNYYFNKIGPNVIM